MSKTFGGIWPALLLALIAPVFAAPQNLDFPSGISGLSIPAKLFKPDGEGPFPAVVIMHDCSGLGPRSSGSPARWARELLQQGYVVLIPDSFSPRGVQDGVIESLDKLIAKLEEQQDQASGGGGSAGSGNQGEGKPIAIGAFYSALITFTMFEAAYYCEIIRAGIRATPRGQIEAALTRTPLEDTLPHPVLRQLDLIDFATAVHTLHHPPPGADQHALAERSGPAWRRVKFDELLARNLDVFGTFDVIESVFDPFSGYTGHWGRFCMMEQSSRNARLTGLIRRSPIDHNKR